MSSRRGNRVGRVPSGRTGQETAQAGGRLCARSGRDDDLPDMRSGRDEPPCRAEGDESAE
ncbi:hypothetical protein GCM10010446_60250 [Streptomyces enissocaesilis]|uniref:Uncharacterized protein n=1 Tax=Streptomyces enissocaesilis TaxID=332589 RepID=A0ABN3XLK7_9ACTN